VEALNEHTIKRGETTCYVMDIYEADDA
jgi:hypothetical protein